MKAHRKQKLMIAGFIVVGAGLITGLLLYAFNQGINVFFTPTDIAEGEVPPGQNVRIGGMVKNGSLAEGEGTTIHFVTTDCFAEIPVTYTGVLPDLFREGQGVVAEGMVNEAGTFEAETIFAKHDENYMSAEVKAALEQAEARGGLSAQCADYATR